MAEKTAIVAESLASGRGRTKKGYFWVLARDDRPRRGGAPPAVVYSYAPGRSAENAAALLKGNRPVMAALHCGGVSGW